MVSRTALALVLVAVGCVLTQSVVCDDGTLCPSDTRCALAAGGDWTCVSDDQLAQCDGLAEGAPCTFGQTATQGTCFGGACLPSDGTCNNDIIDTTSSEQCDSDDGLAHDGCSGTCLLELRGWQTPPIDTFPRSGASMVFDSHRNRLVLFGGGRRTTWEWDGIGWSVVTPVVSPQPRSNFGMAYDAKRKRVVVFGGRGLNALLDDTWEWDGVAWHLATPPTTPPGRAYAMMGYDPVRQRVVLFGGSPARRFLDNDLVLGDLWEWDGETWTERVLPGGPGGRAAPITAYDPRRGVFVLFGGLAPNKVFRDDTWELSAQGWTQLAPATTPPPRARGTAGYDPASGQIVMHGGAELSGTERGDIWTWDGTDWTRRLPDTAVAAEEAAAPFGREGYLAWIDGSAATLIWNGTAFAERVPARSPVFPSARSSHAGAVDVAGRRMLIHGGIESGGAIAGDTWMWDGAAWSLLATTPAPPARHESVMAYDEARGEFVLFGGLDANIIPMPATLSDTWVHDGTKWTQRTPATLPPGRANHVMVYDPDRKQVVMFGGSAPADAATWVWDGTDWSVATTTGPPIREGASAAFDPIDRTIVMFGGRDSTGELGSRETWTYGNGVWTLHGVANGPQARTGGALAANAPHHSLILFGGFVGGIGADDVWEWKRDRPEDPPTWHFVSVAGPGPRMSHTAFPLFDGTGVGVFGGRIANSDSAPANNLIVQLVSRSETLDETCGRADLDGDGRVRCADPDCWPVCEPTCPPGAACDPAGPRCGDGACARETCESCPEDCGACAAHCGDGFVDPGEDASTCVGDYCIDATDC